MVDGSGPPAWLFTLLIVAGLGIVLGGGGWFFWWRRRGDLEFAALDEGLMAEPIAEWRADREQYRQVRRMRQAERRAERQAERQTERQMRQLTRDEKF